jgi:transposase InsO family protein
VTEDLNRRWYERNTGHAITYIPMERGFVYLAVVLDWATRRVLSWQLSITMEAAFCVETLEDALARRDNPCRRECGEP